MPNYLFAFHGGGMPDSEEEGKRVMAAWGAWYQELGDAVIDGGNPIGKTKVIASDGSVSDDAGASPVSGYSVVTASDMDDAVAKAKGCPILESGGSVEVGETYEAM